MTSPVQAATLVTLEDLFRELRVALRACARAVPRTSDAAVELTLLAGEAASRAADDVPGSGRSFEDQIGADATFLGRLRRTFDVQARGLAGTPERRTAEEVFARLAETLRDAERGPAPTIPTAQFAARGVQRPRIDLETVVAFPVLTTETGGAGGTLTPGGGAATAASGQVQRTVEVAVRQVLGRLPKYTDAKAFTAALTATFELQPQDGHTVAVWRPRGFVGQTELGGSVTGRQASLYARATDALAAALPVLRGLTPLRVDADVQEMDAARSVVESQLTALVNELGTPGGARRARVEGLFAILLDDEVVGLDGSTPSTGMLGYLSDVFGLRGDQVNTIEEEQVYSNFLLLEDHVRALRTSWGLFDDRFDEHDLGTNLVFLSNAFQVVAESVDEFTAALDSVFVGSAERTVARFPTTGGRTMLVSELLSWTTSFATQEGPELVQQGGRRGLGPVESTAELLIEHVDHLGTALDDGANLPPAMRHPRVRFPLQELQTYLGQVRDLAVRAQTVPAQTVPANR